MKRIISIIGVITMTIVLIMPTATFGMTKLDSMIQKDPSLESLVIELQKKGVPDDYIVSKLP